MAVPDYQRLMLPLLELASERKREISVGEAVRILGPRLRLSDDDLKERLLGGKQKLADRVAWAATYLKKAGVLEPTRRGYFRITERGENLLKEKLREITVKVLAQYPEFALWLRKKTPGARKSDGSAPSDANSVTPSEALESAYADLREELADEVLAKLKNVSPAFFERIVLDLLLKMGYGGSRADAGKAIGRSGDGGVDGIIYEDKLGLDVLYIQAKCWSDKPVGGPDLRQFAGALQEQKATKGVFMTTSRFTDDAQKVVRKIGSKIVLIDGMRLANLMIEHGVGVTTMQSYHVKRIDDDYFDEGL